MEYKNLGASGLKVSRIIFGCMSFGDHTWGDWVIDDEDTALNLLKKAYDLGIRTFDTADSYSNGASERILGLFLKKYNIKRSTVVVLSKVFFPYDEDTPVPNSTHGDPSYRIEDLHNFRGLSRKHIFDSVEQSVRRLGTYIDVLQIHRYDNDTPDEEVMKALNDVVSIGKVRYIGASSMKAYQFAKLQFTAEKNGWTKFISMQNYYNLLYREEEREMIPFCNETGVGLLPWSPIGRGALAKPVSKQSSSLRSSVDKVAKKLGLKDFSGADETIVNRVEELSIKKEVSMAQIAIAWILTKGVTPIIGFNKLERIDEAVEALKVVLTGEEIDYLEAAYVPKPSHV